MSGSRFAAVEAVLWARAGVAPTEHFVTLASGPRVRVQDVGEGPPVVFVHGAMNGGTSWFELIGRLPGFRCLAIDRPGCGLSEPVLGAAGLAEVGAVKAYADRLIPEVLDALGIKRAAVVATSFGGLFAFRGAAAHPDRIERITEFSWPMGAPMDKVTMSLRLGAVPGMRRLMPRIPMARPALRAMLRQIGLRRALATGKFSDEMLDWFLALLHDTDTMANELRSTPGVITPIAGLNRAMLLTDAELGRVTMPVQLLWGDEDPNGGLDIARSFASRLPDSRLVMLDRAGHAPWIDEPDRCATLLAGFLSGPE